MNNKRRLQIECLDQRAMLAVLSVNPQPGDDAGQMLVDAVRLANENDESDEIILAPGTYDLSGASDATLSIDSEIAIRGESPSSVKIVPQTGVTPIVVSTSGNLDLSSVTLFCTWGQLGGGVRVDGLANLTNVAFIGLGHDVPPTPIENSSTFESPVAVYNFGSTVLTNSILVDSLGFAIGNRGTLEIHDAIVAGNRSGVGGNGILVGEDEIKGGDITISNSLVVSNGLGLLNSASETTVINSTFFDNGNVIDPQRSNYGGGIGTYGGVTTIDSDTVVLGNQSQSLLARRYGDQITIDLDDVVVAPSVFAMFKVDLLNHAEAYSLGTPAQVLERVGGRIVADRNELAAGYMAVNSPMTITAGVADYGSGQGVSQVFWDDHSQQFSVILGAKDILSQFADDIPDQSVRAYRDHWGNVHTLPAIDDGTPAARPDLFAATTYELLNVTDVRSTSGARFDLQQARHTLWGYQAPRNFTGDDTLTVLGTDHLGIQRSFEIHVSVVGGLDIQLLAKTSEADGVIDFQLSSAGADLLSAFGSAIQYDASTVRLIDVIPGAGMKVDQQGDYTQGTIAPRVSVAAKADRLQDPGTDLMIVRFERIGEGDPAIRLSPSLYWAADSGVFTDLSSGSLDITYLDAVDQVFGDVNDDGFLTPLDALIILNHLSRPSADGEFSSRLDTNGDGTIAPIDALVIINRLTDQAFSLSSASAAIFESLSRSSDNDEDDDDDDNGLDQSQHPFEITSIS